MSVIPDQLLTPKEVAQILAVKEKTLANWRLCSNSKLSYIKIGNLIRYNINTLQEFIKKGEKNF